MGRALASWGAGGKGGDRGGCPLAAHRDVRLTVSCQAIADRTAITLALVVTIAFAIAFAAEAAFEVTRASDYRTALDATGLMIEDRRLTAHGWETVARRASVASLFAGIIAAAFGLIRSLQARRSTNP